MQSAPLFNDIADGPDGATAHWLHADDTVRLRVGHWPLAQARGTIVIFPGRTEFVEKYGGTAKALQAHGYASAAIDWRGQGLADRLIADRALGHVGVFADYQRDVQAMVAHMTALDLPRPWHLLSHSMGGCIALRSLIVANGNPQAQFASAVFSAPMWGVNLSPLVRGFAWGMSTASRKFGYDHLIAPTRSPTPYPISADFAENALTNDPLMWAQMQRQIKAHPELGIGGPTLRWLGAALKELNWLARQPSPAIPCLTLLGGKETIVAPGAIRQRMANWPHGVLKVYPQGRHEMLLDTPDLRKVMIDTIVTHCNNHG